MKVLKYGIGGLLAEMTWNEINEETVKNIADNGKYIIEEVEDSTEEILGVSLESRVETLESDTAELNEALNMILDEVTE